MSLIPMRIVDRTTRRLTSYRPSKLLGGDAGYTIEIRDSGIFVHKININAMRTFIRTSPLELEGLWPVREFATRQPVKVYVANKARDSILQPRVRDTCCGCINNMLEALGYSLVLTATPEQEMRVYVTGDLEPGDYRTGAGYEPQPLRKWQVQEIMTRLRFISNPGLARKYDAPEDSLTTALGYKAANT